MHLKEYKGYDELDIKITLGRLLINIYYIRFMPPSPDWSVKNHSHSSYELHFIPCGRGTLAANRKNLDITPGTFYLTGPGVYHEQKSNPDDPMAEYCINFDFNVLQSSKNRDYIPETEIEEIIRILKNTNYWFGRDEFNSMELFERIYYELSNPRVGCYISVRNYISQIIINSLRSYIRGSFSYSLPHKTPEDHRRQIVDNLFHYHYDSVTMEQMADSINVSTRQLDRIVKHYYSASFKEKLISIRTENAQRMLKNTRLCVDEIAKKTGFNYPDYFRRVFKRKTGMTPQEYRKVDK